MKKHFELSPPAEQGKWNIGCFVKLRVKAREVGDYESGFCNTSLELLQAGAEFLGNNLLLPLE